jgi:hypothetical protein
MTILYNQIIYETKNEFGVQFVDLQHPKVTWIDGMKTPLQTIGKLTEGYSGIYEPHQVSGGVGLKAVKNLNNTQLRTPFEMIMNIFLIENVTRSFTHQMVRTRHASYVQESMRFIGHKKIYDILVGSNIRKDDIAFDLYVKSCLNDIIVYEKLMDRGIAGEEARDKLPHSILTSLYIGIPLNSLQHMYAQRMCCQAQPGQWQVVMRQIRNELTRVYGKSVGDLLSAPYERGESCGYKADFDRPCTWQKNEQ